MGDLSRAARLAWAAPGIGKAYRRFHDDLESGLLTSGKTGVAVLAHFKMTAFAPVAARSEPIAPQPSTEHLHPPPFRVAFERDQGAKAWKGAF